MHHMFVFRPRLSPESNITLNVHLLHHASWQVADKLAGAGFVVGFPDGQSRRPTTAPHHMPRVTSTRFVMRRRS